MARLVTRRTIRANIFRLKSEIMAFLQHGTAEDIQTELTILRNLERSIFTEMKRKTLT